MEDSAEVKLIAKGNVSAKDISKKYILFLFSNLIIFFQCTKKEKPKIWRKMSSNKLVIKKKSSNNILTLNSFSKTYFDDKYDEYVMYFNHYYLKDCSIVSYNSQSKEIGIECLDQQTDSKVLLFIQIEDDPRGNRNQIWHQELRKNIGLSSIQVQNSTFN
jgi:hypothetical protein